MKKKLRQLFIAKKYLNLEKKSNIPHDIHITVQLMYTCAAAIQGGRD